ncbi:PASTA domain-containing protein [Streptomyces sp. VNUA24]|uniref:PASTA domain-containing protein n=1 Tax=Streptomyces sp. VNUA24 TaxID=3031131 RepID=UPI0023B7F0C1|nr:PASTA domain-containing protein [Streptomyces sp. VNUA24]WEH18524.1 PASTA domain-containing protein [Streptomyces sp. VNUA24]
MSKVKDGFEAGCGCLVVIVLALGLLANACDSDDRSEPEVAETTPTESAYAFKNHVGETLGEATDSARAGDIADVKWLKAVKKLGSPKRSWKVCFQYPAADTPIESTYEFTAQFSAVPPRTSCPKNDDMAMITVPKVKGMTYGQAVKLLKDSGVDTSVATSAYTDEHGDAGKSWKVCSQEPSSSEELDSDTGIFMDVVRPGDACPSGDGLHYRDPANDPDSPSYDGDDNGIPDSNENDGWGSTGSSSGGSLSSGGGGGDSYNPGGCPPGGCDNSRHCPPGGCKS